MGMAEYKILLKKRKDLDASLVAAKAVQEQKQKEFDELCKVMFTKYNVKTMDELKALLTEKQAKVAEIVRVVKEQYPEALGG